MPQPGRMMGSHLKDHFSFLLKPSVLIGIGRGELLFLFNCLAAFGAPGPYSFTFWALDTLSVRTYPCATLAKGICNKSFSVFTLLEIFIEANTIKQGIILTTFFFSPMASLFSTLDSNLYPNPECLLLGILSFAPPPPFTLNFYCSPYCTITLQSSSMGPLAPEGKDGILSSVHP